jgi:hypothetical protein
MSRPVSLPEGLEIHPSSPPSPLVVFRAERRAFTRFCLGQAPSDLECYAAALIYAVIYASRCDLTKTWLVFGWKMIYNCWVFLMVFHSLRYLCRMVNHL